LALDDTSLKTTMAALEEKSFKFLDFSLQIMLAPMVHKLQVLVED